MGYMKCTCSPVDGLEFVFSFGATSTCAQELTPGSVLRDHSCQGSGAIEDGRDQTQVCHYSW